MKELDMSTIYPQVGLGAEGEIFSKATQVTSVGHGAQAWYSTGASSWVNPEPEVVLVANSEGKIVDATHGNDVNDRGKEGKSALLLHRAKVKKGSTAIGPFIRVFDEKFKLDSIRYTEVKLEVRRADGSLKFEGANNMGKISRKPEAIVAAATDDEREHPDGVAVFLGTMTVPLKDDKGAEFTHEEGDVVRVGSPQLGYLSNVMLPANKVQGLEKGALDLTRNLAARGLLVARSQ
jgi:fumarylacetoacetate (FAA) hydrolase family protein